MKVEKGEIGQEEEIERMTWRKAPLGAIYGINSVTTRYDFKNASQFFKLLCFFIIGNEFGL